MPYDEDGKFYTTRIGDDLKGPDAKERMEQRISSARRGARVGARIGGYGGPVGMTLGATLGGISGFILGDQETVFPVDMIAIPAFQAYLLDTSRGGPEFMIYIKEGEVLTQVIQTDAMEAAEVVSESPSTSASKKRKKSKYHQAYSKHFKKCKGKYMMKNGKWKKDGFKRAVKEAHKLTKKGMK